MRKKITTFFLILIALAILAAIIYVLFFCDFGAPAYVNKKSDQAASNTASSTTTPVKGLVGKIITQKNSSTSVVNSNEFGEKDLKNMASSFAERFGSYSNHSNYNNIDDLKIFMSAKMQVWADEFLEQVRKDNDMDIYYGITTKAVVSQVKKFDDDAGEGQVLVQTQRRESTGTTGNSTVFYQDILINFVMKNGAWKVDSAYWQE